MQKNQHWFWGTLKHSKSIYKNVIIASILINLFLLALPLFTMNVYDRIVPNNAIESLWALAIGVILILVFDLVLKNLRIYFLEFAGKKSDIIISSKLFEHVMSIKMDFMPKTVGAFASNLKGFDSVRNFLTSSTLTLLIDLPFSAIFLVVVYLIAGTIVLIPFFIIVIIILYAFYFHKPLQKSVKETYESISNKNGILIESLQNFELIKTLNLKKHSQDTWDTSSNVIAQKSLYSQSLYSSVISVSNFFIQLNTVLVLIAGVYLISTMELSMGALVVVVILSSRAIAPMGQVSSMIVNFEEFKTSLEHLNEIMEMPRERENDKQYLDIKKIQGDIEFCDVTFTYPNESHAILKNISFSIKAGEKVGIIGKNGSGKTTIEKLLLGLYQPESGYITIDGIDIKDLNLISLRDQIAYVPQEVNLFRGTLRSNIIVKDQDADDESIIKASLLGLIDQFVKKHPKGYHMKIGEQGYGLSGGQKQAICIARAFICQDTPIAIMDEPTNSFDSTMESLFIQRIKPILENKTTLLISHKMATMQLVDRLILIDEGKIKMDGKKENVLSQLNKSGQNE